MNADKKTLFDRVCDGLATETEIRELNCLLSENTEALDAWIKYTSLHEELACGSVWLESELPGSAPLHADSSRQKKTQLLWRSVTAAVAGLVIGIFTTSVAWAYASPSLIATASRLMALVDGSFELRSGRLPSGFPKVMGTWSGDESEVIENGLVQARDGKRLLRFIRAERDPGGPQVTPASCDVFQLIDLHSVKSDGQSGDITLEMSAQFLDARQAASAPIRFTCRIFVFSGTPDALRDGWPLTRNDALASGCTESISKGGEPNTWHRVTAKVLLPSDADFAVIQLVAGKFPTHGNQPAQFGEQYVDDVQLTLKTQPALPVSLAH